MLISLTTGAVPFDFTTVSGEGIDSYGRAEGIEGPGYLTFEGDKLSVKGPDTYVWGYSAPYKLLCKTDTGVDVIEGDKVIQSVPVDQIKNLNYSNDYYNNDTIVSWYNYDASVGSTFTLEKGMVGFSDGRSDISSDEVPFVFGQDVVDYAAEYPTGSPILLYMGNYTEENGEVYGTSFNDSTLNEDDDVITVENWDDLQYYCSQDDKDYTLRLKENTNYYPTDVADSNYQINIKNNVHIIGAEGAYIGDVSPDAGKITYTAIKVDDDNGIGVSLENVTFKWIATRYQPDGVFFVMGGNANNIFRNCYFTNITTDLGHSSILHLKRGNATLSNCTFVNCTTDFGCVSIYDPADDPT